MKHIKLVLAYGSSSRRDIIHLTDPTPTEVRELMDDYLEPHAKPLIRTPFDEPTDASGPTVADMLAHHDELADLAAEDDIELRDHTDRWLTYRDVIIDAYEVNQGNEVTLVAAGVAGATDEQLGALARAIYCHPTG